MELDFGPNSKIFFLRADSIEKESKLGSYRLTSHHRFPFYLKLTFAAGFSEEVTWTNAGKASNAVQAHCPILAWVISAQV